MKQPTDSALFSTRAGLPRAMMMYGLGWLGGLGLLSSGMVAAQTPSASQTPTVAPAAVAPQPTVQAPTVAAPTVKVAPVPAAPVRTAPQSSTGSLPKIAIPPQRPAASPSSTQLASPKPSAPTRLPVSTISSPLPDTNRQQSTQLPKIQIPQADRTLGSKDRYIDPTRYDLGATSSYEAPAAVILAERSTGCQAVLRRGQVVPGSVCSRAPKSNHYYQRQAGRNGNYRTVAVTGRPQNPSRDFALRYYNRTRRPPGRLGNGNTRLLFPLALPAPITSIFGWRTHPISGKRRFHTGTDLGAPMGTPVLAAYAGRVAIADFLGGYGLLVSLRHNENTEETRYAHLSELFVKPGEWVKQGDVIGRVGSTGNSTGPHLHFEFRENTPEGWIAQDPGMHLEYAMAQLIQALQTAKAPSKPGA